MHSSLGQTVVIAPQVKAWLEQSLAKELDLPMLPEAAARVIALCDDEDSDARALEAVLERDPSLTACVLKVANSSMYATKEPIVSLQHAASRLGMSTVRNLALTHSLRGRVFDVPGHSSRIHDIWVHCAVASVFAREVGRKLRRNVEAAFLCALIHDVGRPIVLQAAVRMPRTIGTLDEAQLEHVMDVYHEEVGARLVDAWGLADWTAAAVKHHHDPEAATPHEEEVRITRLADLFSHWALVPGSDPQHFPADDPVVAALNLYPEDLDALLDLREQILLASEALQ